MSTPDLYEKLRTLGAKNINAYPHNDIWHLVVILTPEAAKKHNAGGTAFTLYTTKPEETIKDLMQEMLDYLDGTKAFPEQWKQPSGMQALKDEHAKELQSFARFISTCYIHHATPDTTGDKILEAWRAWQEPP